MKPFDWSEQKNANLKISRGLGFEDIINAIQEGNILAVLRHHNTKKYPAQKVYIVKVDNYAYSVPFLEDSHKIFLKTIYPSRKYTKKYITERRK